MSKKIKLFKDFTYYSLIKDAIYHAPCRMATSNDVFNYFVSKYPNLFLPSNSMTWKGNIRQTLSKNPEFVKLRKLNNSKQHFWTHKPLEEIQKEESKLLSCLDMQRNTESVIGEEELNDIYLGINNILNKSIIDNRMKYNSMTFQSYNGSLFNTSKMSMDEYNKHKEAMEKIEDFIEKMESEAKKENIPEALINQIKERRLAKEYNRMINAECEKLVHNDLNDEKENHLAKNKIEPIPSFGLKIERNFSNSDSQTNREGKNDELNYWDFQEENIYKRF